MYYQNNVIHQYIQHLILLLLSTPSTGNPQSIHFWLILKDFGNYKYVLQWINPTPSNRKYCTVQKDYNTSFMPRASYRVHQKALGKHKLYGHYDQS